MNRRPSLPFPSRKGWMVSNLERQDGWASDEAAEVEDGHREGSAPNCQVRRAVGRRVVGRIALWSGGCPETRSSSGFDGSPPGCAPAPYSLHEDGVHLLDYPERQREAAGDAV